MEHIDRITVKYEKEDADDDIVKSACDIAKDRPVILVKDVTNLLILRLHRFSSDHQTIYLKSSPKLINICHLQVNFGHELCH